jgi:hypothetical protein
MFAPLAQQRQHAVPIRSGVDNIIINAAVVNLQRGTAQAIGLSANS